MAQLLQDLPRGEAPLRRRAGDEGMSPGPVRQIHQRSGEGRALRRRGGGLGAGIVDRRNDAEDVDRHVNPAGNRRDLGRLQAARVVASVGKHDNRAAAAFASADAPGCLRNRIVQRRRAERDESRHRLGQRLEIPRERLGLVQPGVERVHRSLVARVEPAQKVSGRFTRAGQMPFHAAADIEQKRDAHTAGLGTEVSNGARPAGVEDFKIAR
jgi:hypothetical protein